MQILLNSTPDVIFPNLNIQIDNLSRVAFSVFGIEVYWYGITMALGVFIALMYVLYRSKKTGEFDVDTILDFLIYAIIFSIIGARLYFVIFTWDNYKDNLMSIFNLRSGGLAIYGAVIGAVITALIYTKLKKIKFLQLADFLSPGLIIGQIIGRWGNFINREAFGGYTNNLFAMQYLKEQVRPSYISPDIMQNLVIQNGVEYIQVHPTFLYESALNIIVLGFMIFFSNHKKFDGQIVGIYFLGYGIVRFFVEGLRTDQLILFNTGIAVSQALSLVLALVALAFIIYNIVNLRKKNSI